MSSKFNKEHPSIVIEKDPIPELPRQGKLFRCPLCPKKKFKPTWRNKVMKHLRTHRRISVQLDSGVIVLGCHLLCREEKKDKHAHYHCPLCRTTIARKKDFEVHVGNCLQISAEPPLDGDNHDSEPDGVQSSEMERDSALRNEDSGYLASMECVDGEQTGIDTNPAPVESVCCEEDKIEPNPVHHYKKTTSQPVEEHEGSQGYHGAQMMGLKTEYEHSVVQLKVGHQTPLDGLNTSTQSRDSSPYRVDDWDHKPSSFDDKVEAEMAPQMMTEFIWKKGVGNPVKMDTSFQDEDHSLVENTHVKADHLHDKSGEDGMPNIDMLDNLLHGESKNSEGKISVLSAELQLLDPFNEVDHGIDIDATFAVWECKDELHAALNSWSQVDMTDDELMPVDPHAD